MKNIDSLALHPIAIIDAEKLAVVASFIKIDIKPLLNIK
jgi:hypothetical protein